MRLVLLEEGTCWPDAPDADNDTVTVVQGAAEPPNAFALRAVRQVLAIEQSGRSISCAHLLLAARFDPEVTAARLLIARGIVTHAASMGTSEVPLRAGRHTPRDLQDSLPCWMNALLGESGSDAGPRAELNLTYRTWLR